VAACADTVRYGVPCRGRCIPQSACLKPDAIHVAASRVADLRRRVCDSHWARTLSTSEPASWNGTSRLCRCRTGGIRYCRRSEHACTDVRNQQPALARPGARDLAGHDRSASLSRRVVCRCRACPSATEPLVISAWALGPFASSRPGPCRRCDPRSRAFLE
jgi:hypothetical protein